MVLFFGVASLFFVFCFCCGEKVGYCFFPSLSAFSLVLPQLSPKYLKCVFLLLLLENFGGLSEKGKREKLFLLAHFFSSQTLSLPNSPLLSSLPLSFHRLEAPILFPSGVAHVAAPGAACSPSAVPSSSAA